MRFHPYRCGWRPANRAAIACTISADGCGRPSLGWTELIVAGLAYLILTAASLTAFAFVSGGTPTTVTVGADGVATLAAVIVAFAARVRSTAALGWRATSLRWVLLGVGGGMPGWLINRGVIL